LIEGITFSAEGHPVEFARSYVRGDRTRYYIERVVVRSSWQTDADGSTPGKWGPPRPPIEPTTPPFGRPAAAGATTG
jgi:hypothetical protein